MIVITGATGKIGSKTAAFLLNKNEKVKVTGRNVESLQRLKSIGAEIEVGNMSDVEFLSQAFYKADAVLLMLPPDMHALNFGAFQDEIGEAQVQAITNAGIKNIVFISSQGAHDIVHTGTVKGLGRQEIRLNSLADDVNVLSLRPEAFMENTIDSLRLFNTIASPLRPDVSTGQIATDDIADFAANKLLNLDFKGKSHQDLLGDRDYTQSEIAEIVGEALGRPSLKYQQLTYLNYKTSLLKTNMSESRADMITERYKAINEGYFNNSVRDAISTTPTSFRQFAQTILRPIFTT
ncbi:MAG TPA: NmrA family NAD(P)-binding protein [Niastella sp.]